MKSDQFKEWRDEAERILPSVRWHLKDNLSCRDLEERMSEQRQGVG